LQGTQFLRASSKGQSCYLRNTSAGMRVTCDHLMNPDCAIGEETDFQRSGSAIHSPENILMFHPEQWTHEARCKNSLAECHDRYAWMLSGLRILRTLHSNLTQRPCPTLNMKLQLVGPRNASTSTRRGSMPANWYKYTSQQTPIYFNSSTRNPRKEKD
jgi:hypothetical protein